MNRRALAGLLFLSLPMSALAQLKLPELPSFGAVMEQLPFKTMESTRISMDIRSVFGGQEYDIRDSFARIDLNVRPDAGGRYRCSGDVDGRYLTGEIEPYGDSFRLWGSGLNIDMRKVGSDRWEISGFVDEADGSKHISIALRQRWGPGTYSIFESGLSADVSRFGKDAIISGDMDPKRFGKKSLAILGLFVAVLEAEADKPQPKP